jgi:glutamyl-tRNA reductase
VEKSLPDFWIAGINYKKTDATIRGQYAINNDQYASILSRAENYGLKEFFILSTCNRTEIYGLTSNVDILVDLVCSETVGDKQTFQQLSYIKNGAAAVEHLFNVTAGIDSQVLGDYEILGQVKQAAKFSKSRGYVGPFMERLINSAIQSSKAIKNSTDLSGGTVSVSFAAVQYIRENVADYKHKKILLLGTGKIGRNTSKNLVDYLHNKNITLINRSIEKARVLAADTGLQYAPIEDVADYIRQADIIITSTSSPQPILAKNDLQGCGDKLIIDLAIPYNVDPSVSELENVQLLNVDELSRMKDENLKKREAELPKAEAIIETHIAEFLEWLEKRKHVPVLKALKSKLQQIDKCPFINSLRYGMSADEHRIQKVINSTAIKLQTHDDRGCRYIEAINEFISTR